MVVPTVLAITARRSWVRWSRSESGVTATSATVMGDPPLQPGFDVLTTSFLYRFPILKGSFDRTKIPGLAIVGVVFDGGPCLASRPRRAGPTAFSARTSVSAS